MASSNTSLIHDFINSLRTGFLVKDLGTLHFFLGVEIFSTIFGLFMSQTRYISNLLHKTNMHHSKLMSTPLSATIKL